MLDRLFPMLALLTLGQAAPQATTRPPDVFQALQAEAVTTQAEARPRAYHFGSQGPSSIFSNHTSHTNRLIPVYTFGSKLDLGAITGENSPYRVESKIVALYGHIPANTLNPDAEYGDQADLYRVQKEAVDRGVKHLFIVLFDGLDWESTQAAAIARTGKVYTEGKGHGLNFQDFDADGTARFGFVVTSPTHHTADLDSDAQTVTIRPGTLQGGYDVRVGGPNPWTPGPLAEHARGYIKGANADQHDRAGLESSGVTPHAYSDSSCTAAAIATGVKSYNNGLNVGPDGQFLPTLFEGLQNDGWKVGTVSSVPFNHASPAAMYAHNVFRDDYQDLAREMLGLPSIVQERGKHPQPPGLDVVIGTGFGVMTTRQSLARQGNNGVQGPLFLTEADRKAIDVNEGGPYEVIVTRPGEDGALALRRAAAKAAHDGHRLFGFFGRDGLDHLPYRTADGKFDPAPGLRGVAEAYAPADLFEQPTLADMTGAALAVLGHGEQPFALFVEAGDVDWALHDNNLDNAIGAVFSGEDAIQVIIDWVARNSNWDDSALIVTADHGHYLVIDDPEALAKAARAIPRD